MNAHVSISWKYVLEQVQVLDPPSPIPKRTTALALESLLSEVLLSKETNPQGLDVGARL